MKMTVLAAALALASAAYPQEFRLGGKVSDFTLTAPDGSAASFAKLRGETTVVAFIATQCPVSNDYNDRMKALVSTYAPKGVRFVFVNSNVTEPAATVAEHARSVAFNFPVYKDSNNVVADRFGAEVTPEMFLIDKAGTIRYHGHIDDSRNPARVHSNTFSLALDSLLAGQEIKQPEAKAFGCTIKRVRKSS